MVVGAKLDAAEFVVVGGEKLVIYARLTFCLFPVLRSLETFVRNCLV